MVDITNISQKDIKFLRRKMHIIFQDPFSSLNPRFSALDVSVQAQVLNLLQVLQEKLELTLPFLVHDL